MTTFSTFEEIRAWQETRVLKKSIRDICKRLNVRKDYAFVDQITRAARSISANIAEGNDTATTPEFMRFLSFSRSSTSEVRSHLYDAYDEGYISKQEFDELVVQTRKISGMITELVRYLQRCDPKKRRIKTP